MLSSSPSSFTVTLLLFLFRNLCLFCSSSSSSSRRRRRRRRRNPSMEARDYYYSNHLSRGGTTCVDHQRSYQNDHFLLIFLSLKLIASIDGVKLTISLPRLFQHSPCLVVLVLCSWHSDFNL
jgi:hypothetical protein